jgi:hypothetical protein
MAAAIDTGGSTLELFGDTCVCRTALSGIGFIVQSMHSRPAVRVGSKILVRRSVFDAWLEAHKLKQIDVDIILDEMIASIKAKP